MKSMGSAAAIVVATVASLCMLTDATAQFGGGRRGMHMDKGSQSTASRPAARENVADIVEYRLALLQEDLKLTRDQERGWAAYEDRIKALAADISRERSREQSTNSMNAVEDVNHAVDVARNRLTAWEDIAAAAKTLYDGLAPQQKTLADQRFPSIVLLLSTGSTSGGPVPRPDSPPPGK
jgi:LTXXQ motif family protein